LAERDDFIYSIEGYELILTVFDNMHALDEAVAYIEHNKPDMVLLDYFLGPGGCKASLEILEKIIRCCMGSTDVNIVSGMHPEDVRLKLAKEVIIPMGMGIIQKPFSIEGLIKVIRRSIRKKENV
jgi:response regulator of citrate/malate metabolism